MSVESTEPALRGNFALWGPTGSGKDWMIRSFSRALVQYNDPRSSRYDTQFEHILEDGAGSPVSIEAPRIGEIEGTPVGDITDELFHYKRRGRNTGKTQRVSSHVHAIRVTNAAGDDTVERGVFSVADTLLRAQCLLVLLDHTQLTIGGMTQPEYTDKVQDLFNDLEPLENGKIRFIAACLTKVDQLQLIRQPSEQIRLTFGLGMEQLLAAQGKTANSQLRTFAVSSYGFLRSGRQGNYDLENAHLKDDIHWSPHNVEQPFFWLFEQLERSRLARFSSPIARLFFSRERLQLYRRYPEDRD